MFIYNKKLCYYSIMGVHIAPGLVQISEELIERLKKHSTFEDLLKSGDFKIIRKESETEVIAEEIAKTIDPSKVEELKKELKPKAIIGNINMQDVTKSPVDKKESKEEKKGDKQEEK